MLTEQPDIDTAPAMLALAARPVGILTVVPGPIASATALLRNTLAPAVRVMCGAHESEMDDADGAAIAAAQQQILISIFGGWRGQSTTAANIITLSQREK